MNAKLNSKTSSFLLLLGLSLQLVFFSLSAQQQQLPLIGSQASQVEKIENAGQHSAVQQAPLFMELTSSSTSSKWGFNLRTRTSRTHHGSELDSIKSLKMQLKLQSLKQQQELPEKKSTAIKPVIGSNFEGNWSIVSHPPDNNIAISNGGKIISVNNDGVEYYDQSGTLLYVENWSNFVNDNTLTSTIYDPVVLYDSDADRFVIAVLHGTSSATSQVLVLFSKSNDPSGGWNVFKLSGDPLSDGSWFDYPKLGVSAQEVYVTGNLYDANDNYNQSIVFQIGKSEGYSGGSLNWQYWYNLPNQPFAAFTLVPASYGHQGAIGPGILFVSSESGGDNRIVLWQLTDYINNNPAMNAFTVNVTPYSPAGDGLMPNTSKTLDNSDCRILTAFYLNDVIHYVFNSDIGQGWNGIHYNRMNVVSLTNQTATLGMPGSQDYAFPVVASFSTQATDPSVVISYLHSSSSVFPSTSVVNCDANMQWSQSTLIKAGSSYIDFLAGNKQRWGDYNGMSRKHNSSVPSVWSATSYGTDIVTSSGSLPNTYKTWIAQVQGTAVSLEETQAIPASVDVFPNPLTDLFQVEFSLDTREEISIEIVGLTGKQIKLLYRDTPKSTENRLSFNRGALAPGHYFISISNNQKSLYREKIIVH